ncbi:hypothetical protein [Kordiimonas sp.]|uniref:hypothetical protein n=1 Tax=Kordiimonas sp. TaxID=1970157 RepID=UPI003B51AD55
MARIIESTVLAVREEFKVKIRELQAIEAADVQELEELKSKIEKTKAARADLEKGLDAIELIICRAQSNSGSDAAITIRLESNPVRAPRKRSKAQMILATLPDSVEDAIDRNEVSEALQQQGLNMSGEATYMNLSRLYKRKLVGRVKHGKPFLWYRKQENAVSSEEGR